MEKESFYTIVDEMCTYNFKSYFENSEWYKESLASQVESEQSPSKSEDVGSLREDILSHMDDLHKRKLKLFEKKFKSYQELESKEPHLIMVQNHPAERYLYTPWIKWDKYDPLLHPEELPNLYKEIKSSKFQEIFYQPINSKFLDNLETFIKTKIAEPEPEIKKEEKDKEEKPKEDKNKEKEKAKIDLPHWILALDIYYILNIYQGNYKRISNMHNYLKKDENISPKYSTYLEKNFALVDSILKIILNKVFMSENNYKPYPIMRNWAINDIFNMTKNLLFVPNKGSYSFEKLPSTAICTDSKYLYIILYGICGGLYKVGTGNQGTIKGQVYLKNIVVNTVEHNPMMVYVKSTNRIYLKTNQSKLGHLKIINPENLTLEKIINLNIPKEAKTKTVLEKNQNYILLSDDNFLYTIMLEEKEKDNKPPIVNDQDIYYKNNYFSKENPFYYDKKLFRLQQIINSQSIKVSMCLYQYTLTELKQKPVETENDKLVNELFESFSYLFSKEKCKYALEKNGYNMEQAAELLIKISKEPNNETEIKVKPPEELYKSYEINSKVILYEGTCKIDNSNKANDLIMAPELKTKFDVTKFECLKWVLIKNKLYAYKLKEGGVFVFSTRKSDEKEFTVEFNENEILNKTHYSYLEKKFGKTKGDLLWKFKEIQNKLL